MVEWLYVVFLIFCLCHPLMCCSHDNNAFRHFSLIEYFFVVIHSFAHNRTFIYHHNNYSRRICFLFERHKYLKFFELSFENCYNFALTIDYNLYVSGNKNWRQMEKFDTNYLPTTSQSGTTTRHRQFNTALLRKQRS